MPRVLINGIGKVGEGNGLTFPIDSLNFRMQELFHRIRARITGPVTWLVSPNQDYIDLHWHWKGYKRGGTPIVSYAGKEHHVVMALWSIWQGMPVVMEGEPGNRVRKICGYRGCANPHHYIFPFEPQPERATICFDGDQGEIVAERLTANQLKTQAAAQGREE